MQKINVNKSLALLNATKYGMASVKRAGLELLWQRNNIFVLHICCEAPIKKTHRPHAATAPEDFVGNLSSLPQCRAVNANCNQLKRKYKD